MAAKNPKGMSLDIKINKSPASKLPNFDLLRYPAPISIAVEPGETIFGEVIVKKRHMITETVGSSIFISCMGKEIVYIKRGAKTEPYMYDSDSFKPVPDMLSLSSFKAVNVLFEFKRMAIVKNIKIAVGESKFNFEVKIPKYALPSFSGTHGEIIYGIVAQLEAIEYRMDATIPFAVVGNTTLSAFPDALLSSHVETQSWVCMKSCRNGPIRVMADFPRTTYVPEEVIQCNLQIQNKSSRKIVNVVASLEQRLTYIVGNKAIKENVVLRQREFPSVKAKENATHEKVELFRIPVIQETITTGIILVAYEIKFIFTVSHSKVLKLFCPIQLAMINDLDGKMGDSKISSKSGLQDSNSVQSTSTTKSPSGNVTKSRR